MHVCEGVTVQFVGARLKSEVLLPSSDWPPQGRRANSALKILE